MICRMLKLLIFKERAEMGKKPGRWISLCTVYSLMKPYVSFQWRTARHVQVLSFLSGWRVFLGTSVQSTWCKDDARVLVSGHYARNMFPTQAEIQIVLFRKTWRWVEDYCMFTFVWAVTFKAGVFTWDFPPWTLFTFQRLQKQNSSEMGKLVSWWMHRKCIPMGSNSKIRKTIRYNFPKEGKK